MGRAAPHLIAALCCLLTAGGGFWMAKVGTVATAPTVVYVDMAMTLRLTDTKAVDPCFCHLRPLPVTL